MKVYVQVDFEGATGFIEWDDCFSDSPNVVEKRNRLRRFLTAEVNSAVEGLYAGGAKEIIVWDSHAPFNNCNNLYFEDLHPDVWVIIGHKGLPEFFPLLDETFDAGIYIGGHAMQGTPKAVVPHSCMDVNGIKLGEVGMFAAMCGWYKIPMIFVSGDKATVEETQQIIPDVYYVITKEAFGPYSAKTRVPKKSQELIRIETEKALGNINKIKPYTIKAPYIINKKCEGRNLRQVHHELMAQSKWASIETQDIQPEHRRNEQAMKEWQKEKSFLVPS